MAITLALIMGIMIMCATFTVAPVIERTNGVTALQHCSGSPIWIDWLARYIWDFFNIFPAFITITIILFAANMLLDFQVLQQKCCWTFKSHRQLRVIHSSFHSQSSRYNFRLNWYLFTGIDLDKSLSDSDLAPDVHLEFII